MKEYALPFRRSAYFVGALLLAVGAILPVLLTGKVHAGQVDSRSIKISSSTNGATGVTYHVAYTAAATYTVKGIVVDFCSDSPLMAVTCTAPSGFAITTPAPANQVGISGFADASSTTSTLKITNNSGSSMTSGVTLVSFDIVATNPTTTNTSFYARIVAYPNASGANSPATYTDTAPGTYSDYGGVALSTGNVINITTKVQESITFCVYLNSGSCSNSAINIKIGHGANSDVIDSTQVDNNPATSFDLATNATHGAIVRIKGPLPTSGSNDINAVNAGAGTAAAMVAGTEAFGLYITPGTGVTADANYTHTTNQYGWDTTSTDNTTTTYGDTIATTAGPILTAASVLNFGATASLTTPAGVYATSVQLIATGSY